MSEVRVLDPDARRLLERAAEAHALMESSAHIGKIMLTVAD